MAFFSFAILFLSYQTIRNYSTDPMHIFLFTVMARYLQLNLQRKKTSKGTVVIGIVVGDLYNRQKRRNDLGKKVLA